jgi:hypothetical protein
MIQSGGILGLSCTVNERYEPVRVRKRGDILLILRLYRARLLCRDYVTKRGTDGN